MDAGEAHPGYTSQTSGIHHTQDAADIFQTQSFASLRTVCLRQRVIKYLKAITERDINPGIIAVIRSFGSRMNFHALCGAPHKG